MKQIHFPVVIIQGMQLYYHHFLPEVHFSKLLNIPVMATTIPIPIPITDFQIDNKVNIYCLVVSLIVVSNSIQFNVYAWWNHYGAHLYVLYVYLYANYVCV